MARASLKIVPSSLYFPPPLTRPITNVLVLNNTTGGLPVAFKVKTTTPKRYCVKPRWGIIKPNDSVEIQITMHAMKEDVDISEIGDKFLVESAQLTPTEQANYSQETLWKALPKERIVRQKLKCHFVSQVDDKLKVVLLNDNSVLIHSQDTELPSKRPVDGPEGDEEDEEDDGRERLATLIPAPAAVTSEPVPETEHLVEAPVAPVSAPYEETTEAKPGEYDMGRTHHDTPPAHEEEYQQEEEEEEVERGQDEQQQQQQQQQEEYGYKGMPVVHSLESPYHAEPTTAPTPGSEPYVRYGEPTPEPTPVSQYQSTGPLESSYTFGQSATPAEDTTQQWSHDVAAVDDKMEQILQQTRTSLGSRTSETPVAFDQSQLDALQAELNTTIADYTQVSRELTIAKEELSFKDEQIFTLQGDIDALKRRLKEADAKLKEGLRQRHTQKESVAERTPQPTTTVTVDSNKYSLITLFIVAIIFFLIGKLL